MKRTISFFLLFAVCFGVCACEYFRTPSNEEIREAVEQLLPDAYTAEYIIYGPGLPLDEAEKEKIDPTWTSPHYIKVSDDAPCKTEKEVRALVHKAFSKDRAKEMLEYAFENNDNFMSRYHEYSGFLTIDVVQKKPFAMIKQFKLDTLNVVSGNGYACEAEIECILANDLEAKQTLQLVMEDGKWLFDGPAY